MAHGLAALRTTNFAFLRNHHFAAVVAVERGYAVTPPKLAGYAPIANIVHPIKVILFKSIGHELDVAVLYRLDSRLGKLVHLYKPLE